MFGLSDDIIHLLRGVLRAHPEVERAVIYGSRARGDYFNGSDIDLTLVGPRLTEAILHRIAMEMDSLPIPHTVDLSIRSSLRNPALIQDIDKQGVEFFAS